MRILGPFFLFCTVFVLVYGIGVQEYPPVVNHNTGMKKPNLKKYSCLLHALTDVENWYFYRVDDEDNVIPWSSH